tara:strand:+ start:348 stop:1466 length:1119 start_codon:yes stop_codon:yes gene_type:complete
MNKGGHSLFKKVNIISISFLVSFGILLNLSASSVQGLIQFNDNFHFIKRHIASIVIGLLIFKFGKKLSLNNYKKLANAMMVSITFILFLVLTYGIVAGGSRRWIDLGVINLQPSEFAKPIIILWIAYHLSKLDVDKSDFYYLKRSLFLPALCCLLILLEPDFGTTVTISGIILMQLIFSEIKITYPIGLIAISPIPIYLAINSGGYRFDRFNIWYSKICNGIDIPTNVLRDDCWHLYQSKIAISSGGLFGLGPGTSRARWGSLPNSWSDFIGSIVGEEYGFVGFIVLILAFVFVIFSFYGLALTASTEFNRLYFVGIGSWILIQTIFNLGGIVGLLPITGIVLPFVAYGGSAMVSIFIALTISYTQEETQLK